ncbi:glycoside hydrolase family 18 protein [Xylariomycetidae sp. FL0641]|nr:glycoside hydrolase family 18 protein [Xylariomycetidae sp. FL0641]
MLRVYSRALTQALLLGVVYGVEQPPADCALATTTIFLPTTIYAAAPTHSGNDYCSGPQSTGHGGSGSGPTPSTTDIVEIPTSVGSTTISATNHVNTSVASTSSIRTTTELPKPTGVTGLPPPPPPPSPPTPFRGYKNAVYFTNWGVNASNYHPQELPVSELTHVLYAFADIAANGTVFSSDPATDVEKRYPGDGYGYGWGRGERGGGRQQQQQQQRNAYGVVKQLYIHKKWNRNLKVLLSIGGWNYSPKFAAATATEAGRQTFARTAVALVADWGFDGIDLDWEYPADEAQKANFVELLAACRAAFDQYSFRHRLRYRFLITVASSASALNQQFMDLPQMNRYIDIWHLMSYDYSGSWDTTSGHQANVFANLGVASSTKLSTDDAVSYYESLGVDSQKILMGLPLYGRSFEGTSGLGQNYTSVGKGGPQEGVWFYKDLPKRGAKVEFDDVAKATYSYDPKSRELISYDNVFSTTFKAHYLQRRRLGGAFFWEARGDKAGAQSLVNTMSKNLRWLDDTPNNLHYPTSQYANIRFGMPGA